MAVGAEREKRLQILEGNVLGEHICGRDWHQLQLNPVDKAGQPKP